MLLLLHLLDSYLVLLLLLLLFLLLLLLRLLFLLLLTAALLLLALFVLLDHDCMFIGRHAVASNADRPLKVEPFHQGHIEPEVLSSASEAAIQHLESCVFKRVYGYLPDASAPRTSTQELLQLAAPSMMLPRPTNNYPL